MSDSTNGPDDPIHDQDEYIAAWRVAQILTATFEKAVDERSRRITVDLGDFEEALDERVRSLSETLSIEERVELLERKLLRLRYAFEIGVGLLATYVNEWLRAGGPVHRRVQNPAPVTPDDEVARRRETILRRLGR